ncbi:hypothetical protein N7510_002776 [Penicillium lagena]|uniref:uncharacterized protein n=1 Tax=Penicillium lagena TaxID=94218 RepID=UPI002540DA32|nr:uncharacterized protein N7510_002776 [Penicillium lagena]KAJ5618792.1 hypothetical protein N7510_002776 [Penicillium lagena]
MKPTSPPNLSELVVELIELIADSCDGDSILQLRLVCRELQTKTIHYYARRFFSSVKTDLSSDSLHRINAVSQHQLIRPYVQGLAFMLQKGVGHGIEWERYQWGPLSEPLQIEAIRTLQNNLLHCLTNCRSFFIFCRYPEGQPDLGRVTITDAVRFRSAWSNLKKLSLEQYLTLENFGFLLELVLSAPNLETLLLNLGSHDLSCEFIHELAETGALSQLHELALFRTSMHGPDVTKLLRNIQGSLCALTLYHVSLSPDDSWVSIIQALGEDFLRLQSISLYYLWCSTPSKELLAFPDLGKVPALHNLPEQHLHMFYSETSKSPTVLGLEYSGPKMSQVLRLLQTTSKCTG